MRSRLTAEFRALYRKLPVSVQRQARAAYKKFKHNPYHPSLQFKQLKPHDIYSVRITQTYRALGIREQDTISWYWIGPHSRYDKKISE